VVFWEGGRIPQVKGIYAGYGRNLLTATRYSRPTDIGEPLTNS